ncbi:hypothetical protein [Candidatus Methylobacter favarea]|nr:hypothetical protein [Candidatus Methylobacter favarea]
MKISPAYRKIIYGLVVITLILIITIPDVLVNLLLEFTHVLFESIEIALDTLVEQIFQTGLHETQVIVFYLLLFLAIAALYSLWLMVPPLYRLCKESLLELYSDKKTRFLIYWNQLTPLEKIKLFVVTAGAVYLLLVMFAF